MSRFSFSLDDKGVCVAVTKEKQGLFDRFRHRERVVFQELVWTDKPFAITLARIRGLDRDGKHHRFERDQLFLDHWMVSRLDDFSTQVLGLPSRLSEFVFHAEMRGNIGSPRFSLDWWWQNDGKQVRLNRTGAIVQSGTRRMRLPAPIFDAIELSQAFDSNSPLPAHWEALAKFREAIGLVENEAAHVDGFLERVEIVSCDRVGLAVSDDDPLAFAAVPFSSKMLNEEDEVSVEMAAITGLALENFKQDANRRGGQPAYQVGENRYLILDRSAVPVIDVISHFSTATEEEKRDFIENAERYVADAIEDALRKDGQLNELVDYEAQEETIENAFQSAWAETREWAERVIEIRKWKKPELEFIEGGGTNWLSSDVDAKLGELLGTIPDEELEDVVNRLKTALERGDESIDTSRGDIPVRPIVLEALQRRLEILLARKEETRGDDGEVTAILPVTHENFWSLNFQQQLRNRPIGAEAVLPETVHQTLRPYQAEGFAWQVDAWRAGIPGILNADEQGLGKTLQTLSFLAWLSSAGKDGGSLTDAPFLIVAPTSLLRNWEAEIEAHLAPGIWGEPVRLYGPSLRPWRVRGARGRDIEDGEARLDLSELSRDGKSRIVITTYQTLSNYAVSFAENPFSVVIFDEIQNLKNPATLRAAAARAVKAEFRIGLTGTPVENATRDLWAVMDQLFPGALGALNDFRKVFDVPRSGNMQALHRAVFQSQAGYPSLALRRTKDAVVSELPTKTRVLHPRIMPEVQALRYDEARRPGQSLFGLLHHIRRTSLHPGLVFGETPAEFTKSSARIEAAMEILACIKNKNERALIFVENRDVQSWFAEIVRIEFDLSGVDIINGSTPVSRRHEITQRFQRHLIADEGFDILVMGPRAAGTGLTLTAANHVIHLSRWWNPAVEEQCNDRTHRIGQTRPVTVHIPLAIHPRLQRGSFDCLLQALMRRKQSLADRVLWPSESDEGELHALYDAVVAADESVDTTEELQGLSIAGYPDLVAEELDQNTIRVSPRAGGASVVVSTDPERITDTNYSGSDVEAVLLAERGNVPLPNDLPVSVLGGTPLWPEFILPE